MSKPPKPGDKGAVPPTPPEAPRPQPKKLKLVPVGDIPVASVRGIVERDVSVPAITEERLYELQRLVAADTADQRSPAEAAARFVIAADGYKGDAKLPQFAPPAAERQPAEKKIDNAMKALPVVESNLLRMLAHYRVVHGQSLRVHEELSRNLGVNIGDLVVTEEIATKRLSAFVPEPFASALSPVCYLVLFLYFLDEQQVAALFSSNSFVSSMAGVGGGSSELLRALLTKSVKEYIARTAAACQSPEASTVDAAATSAPSGGTQAVFARGLKTLGEFRSAVQSKGSEYLLNKWIGSAAVLLSTLEVVASSKLDWASRLAPDAIDAAGNVYLRALIQHRSPSEAVGGIQTLLTSQLYEGAPMSLPLLLPLTASVLAVPKRPTTTLRRNEVPPAEEVPPPPPAAANAPPPPQPTWEEKIAAQFENLHLELTPLEGGDAAASLLPPGSSSPGGDAAGGRPTSQQSSRPGSQGSTRASSRSLKKEVFTREMEVAYIAALPTAVTLELCVPPALQRKVCPLFLFAHQASAEECVLLPMAQIAIKAFIPEQLKISATVVDVDRTDAIVGLLASFTDRVLGDATKASIASAKICARLMSQFVPPHHCHRHPANLNAFFCVKCRKFICVACTNESHSGHAVNPISAFCMNEALRVEPKAIQLAHRVASLKAILTTIDANTEKLFGLVHAGVDDVLLRIHKRRALLHGDAAHRAQVQLKLLKQERVALEASVDRINAVKHVVQKVSSGCVMAIPTVKPVLSRQVVDQMHPRLPTEHLKRLVRVLTWSNPSKYLTQFIYPPAPIDLSKTKVMVPMALQSHGSAAASVVAAHAEEGTAAASVELVL